MDTYYPKLSVINNNRDQNVTTTSFYTRFICMISRSRACANPATGCELTNIAYSRQETTTHKEERSLITQNTRQLLSQPLEFISINHYFRFYNDLYLGRFKGISLAYNAWEKPLLDNK